MIKIRKKQIDKSEETISLKELNSHKNYLKFIAKIFTTISFGIIFVFIFFEIGLFAFGKLERIIQKTQNKFFKKDEFVILALGESTTVPMFNLKMQDYSWPAYLEKLLNEKNPNKKFKIINEGRDSINSDKILSDLEENLIRYEPNLVISMMGINDFFGEVAYETAADIEADGLLSKLRTYKLIKFLIANVKDKNESKTKKTLDCDSEESCLSLAFQQKPDSYLETELAIKFLEKTLDYNPNNLDAIIELGLRHMFIYTENKKQNEKTIIQAIGYFEKAIEYDPENSFAHSCLINALEESIDITNEVILLHATKVKTNIEKYEINDVDLFLALAICARCHGEEKPGFFRDKNQIFYLQKALEIEPNHTHTLLNLARYYIHEDKFKKAEKYYLKIIKKNTKDKIHSNALIELASLYLGTNREEMANEIFKQAMNANGMYAINYQKLYETLASKNIKLIAVQYPMRSIEPLELIFQNNTDVLLVDNELLFKNLIKEESYQALFVDRFAGDFGHCSERGNLFLAENIKSVILENWEEINGEN